MARRALRRRDVPCRDRARTRIRAGIRAGCRDRDGAGKRPAALVAKVVGDVVSDLSACRGGLQADHGPELAFLNFKPSFGYW